jgi:hypothetical protein
MVSNLTSDQKKYYDNLPEFEKLIYMKRIDELNNIEKIFQNILKILIDSKTLYKKYRIYTKRTKYTNIHSKHINHIKNLCDELEKFNKNEFTVWIKNLKIKQEYPIYYRNYTVEDLQEIHDQRLKSYEYFTKQLMKYSNDKKDKKYTKRKLDKHIKTLKTIKSSK